METCTLRVIDHLVLVVLFTLLKSLDGTSTPRTATDYTLDSRSYFSVPTDLSETALPKELTTSITEYTKGTSTNFGDSLAGITDIPRDFSEKFHTEMKSGKHFGGIIHLLGFVHHRLSHLSSQGRKPCCPARFHHLMQYSVVCCWLEKISVRTFNNVGYDAIAIKKCNLNSQHTL